MNTMKLAAAVNSLKVVTCCLPKQLHQKHHIETSFHVLLLKMKYLPKIGMKSESNAFTCFIL